MPRHWSGHGTFGTFPDHSEPLASWVPDAEQTFIYMRNMGTVKLLTGTPSCSVLEFVCSASADVSDNNPPEGLVVSGAMDATGEYEGVDAPTAAFSRSVVRTLRVSYGWCHLAELSSVLVGPGLIW